MQKQVLVIGDKKFTNDISGILSQFIAGVLSSCSPNEITRAGRKKNVKIILFDCDSCDCGKTHFKALKALRATKKDFILFTSQRKIENVLKAKKEGASGLIVKPYNDRELIARFNAVIHKKTKIACIGGGTGLLNLLMGIKTIPGVHLTSIVSISDDGGSSGRLRASFGIVPPGDIRSCLAAMSSDEALLTQLFQYRFPEGEDDLEGHSFGNLFITALADITGSFEAAVAESGRGRAIDGRVLPSPLHDVQLVADILLPHLVNEVRVEGVSKIPQVAGQVRRVWLEPNNPPAFPQAPAPPDARRGCIRAGLRLRTRDVKGWGG